MMLIPWLSTPLLGRNSLKRFLPASLIMGGVVTAESYLARKRTWWWVYKRLAPKVIGEIPLILGPFIVGSLWILKMTYGRFALFLILNSMIHIFFSFPIMDLFTRYGIGSTVRLKRYQLMLLFFVKSLLLYGIQYLIESVKQMRFHDKDSSNYHLDIPKTHLE